MLQDSPLTMQWCLDCHRHPEVNLREKEDVFRTDWTPSMVSDERRQELAEERNVQTLQNCSVCHR